MDSSPDLMFTSQMNLNKSLKSLHVYFLSHKVKILPPNLVELIAGDEIKLT